MYVVYMCSVGDNPRLLIIYYYLWGTTVDTFILNQY